MMPEEVFFNLRKMNYLLASCYDFVGLLLKTKF